MIINIKKKYRNFNLHVKIFMKYTPGSERILDLGEVAVFKTASKAARPAVTSAAEVVVKVLIQSPQDITVGSCLIIWGTRMKQTITFYMITVIIIFLVSGIKINDPNFIISYLCFKHLHLKFAINTQYFLYIYRIIIKNKNINIKTASAFIFFYNKIYLLYLLKGFFKILINS